ncbi:MAG: SPOR domain-containing protein [Spirochaetaceae bacterium]|jgi:DedD protein|nr:SPOR domain-containing protein [Spirochaetaceae bacterium]
MDKKKLLLVAASAGMFMVIVIGAAILVFTPRVDQDIVSALQKKEKELEKANLLSSPVQDGGAAIVTQGPQQPVQPGWIPLPPVQATGGSEFSTGAGAGAPPYAYQQNSPPAFEGGSYEITQPPPQQSSAAVINVPVPAASGVPEPKEESAPARPQMESRVSRQPVAAPKPPPATQNNQKPQSAAPVKKAAASGYWVQTGSYAQKSFADGAKEYLSMKGISSVVLNTSVGGKTYYRVRVGPYGSQNEADYWLSLIKSIDGMENSQVWKTGSL